MAENFPKLSGFSAQVRTTRIQHNAGPAVYLTTNRRRKLTRERGAIVDENVSATQAALIAELSAPPDSSAEHATRGRLDAFHLPVSGPGNDASVVSH